MNTLPGVIQKISTQGQFALMDIDVSGTMFKCIMTETPDSSFLAIGKSVQVLFKETEVVIALPGDHPISLQNKLSCRITEIEKGSLLCRLTLDFMGHRVISIVTRAAAEQLHLKPQDQILAMIKTNEVILSE